VSNVSVKVRWMKGEEELRVICIKVVVERKGRDESAEEVVYMTKSKGPRTTMRNTAGR